MPITSSAKAASSSTKAVSSVRLSAIATRGDNAVSGGESTESNSTTISHAPPQQSSTRLNPASETDVRCMMPLISSTSSSALDNGYLFHLASPLQSTLFYKVYTRGLTLSNR